MGAILARLFESHLKTDPVIPDIGQAIADGALHLANSCDSHLRRLSFKAPEPDKFTLVSGISETSAPPASKSASGCHSCETRPCFKARDPDPVDERPKARNDSTNDSASLSELKSDLNELKQRVFAFAGKTDTLEDGQRDPSAELTLCRMPLQSVQQGTGFHPFPPHCSPSRDGILSFLGLTPKGNPHRNGIVLAFAADPDNTEATYSPKNATDFGTDSYFPSKNEANQYMG
jgi:hypothetical protein